MRREKKIGKNPSVWHRQQMGQYWEFIPKNHLLTIRAGNCIINGMDVSNNLRSVDPMEVARKGEIYWLRMPNCYKVTVGHIERWLRAFGINKWPKMT